MRERAGPLTAALAFLTVLPVGRRRAQRERELARGVIWFPAVGALCGLVVATVAWACSLMLPAWPSAILAVASGVALTAALHLDGLGDVADAVGASLTGRPPLEVMRDPRLGTFGVSAVAVDLLLQASVIAALVDRFPWEIVAAGALGRVMPIALAIGHPYVGAGSGWVDGISRRTRLGAAALALAIAVPAAGVGALGMVAVGGVVSLGMGRWATRRLGGVTGDVLGAAAELTFTLCLAVALALR
jgi:adenosylcobinamide-GDP ribazoletransferase